MQILEDKRQGKKNIINNCYCVLEYGYSNGKVGRGKIQGRKREIMLNSLASWLGEICVWEVTGCTWDRMIVDDHVNQRKGMDYKKKNLLCI